MFLIYFDFKSQFSPFKPWKLYSSFLMWSVDGVGVIDLPGLASLYWSTETDNLITDLLFLFFCLEEKMSKKVAEILMFLKLLNVLGHKGYCLYWRPVLSLWMRKLISPGDNKHCHNLQEPRSLSWVWNSAKKRIGSLKRMVCPMRSFLGF